MLFMNSECKRVWQPRQAARRAVPGEKILGDWKYAARQGRDGGRRRHRRAGRRRRVRRRRRQRRRRWRSSRRRRRPCASATAQSTPPPMRCCRRRRHRRRGTADTPPGESNVCGVFVSRAAAGASVEGARVVPKSCGCAGGGRAGRAPPPRPRCRGRRLGLRPPEERRRTCASRRRAATRRCSSSARSSPSACSAAACWSSVRAPRSSGKVRRLTAAARAHVKLLRRRQQLQPAASLAAA